MGRPPKDTKAVTIRLHQKTLDAIDAISAEREDAPSRPEVVRRILRQHLAEQGHDVEE